MFNRTRNIPVRFWIVIGIFAGMAAAVVLSGGLSISGSNESPMSSINSHNADIAEVMAMLRN